MQTNQTQIRIMIIHSFITHGLPHTSDVCVGATRYTRQTVRILHKIKNIQIYAHERVSFET